MLQYDDGISGCVLGVILPIDDDDDDDDDGKVIPF
jgi:hypothetical protein